jgi:hypothetical protein
MKLFLVVPLDDGHESMNGKTTDVKTNLLSNQIHINQPEITQMKLFLVVPLDDGHEFRGVVVVTPV